MDSIRSRFPNCTHLMVVDFEATCGPSVSKGNVEIIEVGALLCPVEMDTFDVNDLPTFHSMVKPQRIKKISSFCTKLTGIRQQDVQDAPVFLDMLVEWKAFMSTHNCSAENTIFGSWSNFDPKQLRVECLRYQSDFSFGTNIDLQKEFKKAQKHTQVYSVKKALETLQLEFDGFEHTALGDAKNTARLVLHANW